MRSRYKIMIEILCEDCQGSGDVGRPGDERETICPACDGEGYQTERISLDALKTLLEGGSL